VADVLTVDFVLDGQPYTAINGGPSSSSTRPRRSSSTAPTRTMLGMQKIDLAAIKVAADA
jgi:predicted 3-demethylubiquinone-9 3-methyltransferase (glyoxalase superfamily)